MGIQLALYDQPGGALLNDLSNRAEGLTVTTNNRGFADLACFVPLGRQASFDAVTRGAPAHVVVTGQGGEILFEGRLEDAQLVPGGVSLRALGYARALSDAPYTALWSDPSTALWSPAELNANTLNLSQERMQIDTNNRLYLAPQKGASYDASGGQIAGGALTYTIPSGSSRQIVGVSFDFETRGALNWTAGMQTRNADYSSAANQWIYVASTGTTPGSVFRSFAGVDRLLFFFVFGTAAPTVFAGETGTECAKLTNVRVVTSTANMVNTTITVAQAAGANVTSTVGSTARMYVGQKLHIGIAAALGETVIVEQILSSTQFVADYTAAAGVGVNVQAHVIYADEIAKDLISTMSSLNSFQLSSATDRVQSPALDLQHELYEDLAPADVLDSLATRGDNQTTPRMWEWGVYAGRRLHYRPRIATRNAWYVDATSLDVLFGLDALANSVYAVYQDANNRTLRTAATASATSIARYLITRRVAVSANTTSATQAGVTAAAALADRSTPQPQSGLRIKQVFDASGALWPLAFVHAGDTVVIRNLPPTLAASAVTDRLHTFRIARTEYHAEDNTLLIEPETPMPTLEVMLAAGLLT